MGDNEGLTLTFSVPVDAGDVAVMTIFVLWTLGGETTVRVGQDSPCSLRLTGGSAEDLVRVAEAFYRRDYEGGR